MDKNKTRMDVSAVKSLYEATWTNLICFFYLHPGKHRFNKMQCYVLITTVKCGINIEQEALTSELSQLSNDIYGLYTEFDVMLETGNCDASNFMHTNSHFYTQINKENAFRKH